MLEDLKPHIQDLRKRLIVSISVLFIAFVACFGFWEEIFHIIKLPLVEVLGSEVRGKFIASGMIEGIFIAMKSALFAALVISTPVIFWQVWIFVAPGLYKNEKKVVIPFVFFGTTMFAIGVVFSYFGVLPFIIKNVLLFGNDQFEAYITAENYFTFFIRLVIGFGIAFELPVLCFFLGKVGLITDESLKNFFKYAVVLIFIIAALIAPPDAISQILLAIPLTALYGISIVVLKFVNPAQPQDEEEDEEDIAKTDLQEKQEDKESSL
ncbi:twin-arginine translocase subunit TatC [Helicobacter sp. MIT 21-1697]|uniref:twin-arginine translocase subunit TatC n=1 Tax=Helicobacter sp. MIT 21-1697 TaxID=2993733 RepID=UPI00224ADC4C|nr:twin-arginine translocase subunit TatC [Helicobacter sp. MIT 21-1697]MCX2717497.1 twin-arginine translocase subunit TatC [Helicobacter sp. MIT 21-1697]